MTVEPVWVRSDVVTAIHQRQLAEHGGATGVRDAGLLASALDRPRNLLAYGKPAPDLARLAAAYGFGIARDHPFVDGNKRTALVVLLVFLKLNGVEIVTSAQESYEAIMSLAAGKQDEEALANWLRNHTAG
jgi:death-on-curing protein